MCALFLSLSCADSEFEGGAARQAPGPSPSPVEEDPREETEEEPGEAEKILDEFIDAILSCLPIEPPNRDTVRLGCSVVVQPEDADKSPPKEWDWQAEVDGDGIEFSLEKSEEAEFEVEINLDAEEIKPAVRLTVGLEINGEAYRLTNRYEPN